MIASTILGSLVGFAGSALGPIAEYFNKKEDAKLAIRKMEHAAILSKQGFDQEQIIMTLRAPAEEHQRLIDHDIAISKGTGFIAGLQKSVRPMITYAFFGLFAAVEVSLLYNLGESGMPWNEAVPYIWDGETSALFATVLSFWFGNRVYEKRAGTNAR